MSKNLLNLEPLIYEKFRTCAIAQGENPDGRLCDEQPVIEMVAFVASWGFITALRVLWAIAWVRADEFRTTKDAKLSNYVKLASVLARAL